MEPPRTPRDFGAYKEERTRKSRASDRGSFSDSTYIGMLRDLRPTPLPGESIDRTIKLADLRNESMGEIASVCRGAVGISRDVGAAVGFEVLYRSAVDEVNGRLRKVTECDLPDIGWAGDAYLLASAMAILHMTGEMLNPQNIGPVPGESPEVRSRLEVHHAAVNRHIETALAACRKALAITIPDGPAFVDQWALDALKVAEEERVAEERRAKQAKRATDEEPDESPEGIRVEIEGGDDLPPEVREAITRRAVSLAKDIAARNGGTRDVDVLAVPVSVLRKGRKRTRET
jgi:hypothetical protein